MKRLLLFSSAAVMALLLALLLGRHAIAEFLIVRSFSKGEFRLSVGATRFHPLASSLRLSELTLYNPSEYPEPVAMRIDALHFDYSLRSLFSREQRWPLVSIDMPEIHVITLPDGRVNLEAFQEACTGDKPDAGEEEGEGRDYRIDTLEIKIGSLTMLTVPSGEAEPTRQVLNLNLDKTYHGVIDTQVILDDLSQAMVMNLLPQMLGELLGEGAAGEMEGLFGDIRDLGLDDLLDGPAEVTVPPPRRAPANPAWKPDDLDELMQDL